MFENLRFNNSDIHFGNIGESAFAELLKGKYANSKKIIFTDETVCQLWIQDLTTNFSELTKAEIIQIPAGEEYKSIEVCTQVWEAMSEYQIGRGDLLINFGGGVITDMGGFIASLYKRGMDFINIPTTLLSMVDASVGGKTGVDLGPHKNQIGVFSDAVAVFVDERYLDTLEPEQLYSGYAEMIKHALISDADYWEALKTFDPTKSENRLKHIHHSVKLKKDIVEQDREESGVRKILNFGHTVGHGIEGMMLDKQTPILHGHAVAIGMLVEAQIGNQMDLISEEDLQDIESVLNEKFDSLNIKASNFKDIIKLMYNDKKNRGGIIQFSLLKGIGTCDYDIEVTDKQILEALKAKI